MKKIAFIFLLTTMFLSCKKDKKTDLEQLPEATQEGKNTFGCLINGEVYKPKGNFFSTLALHAEYYKKGIVAINVKNLDSHQYMSFYISNYSRKTSEQTDTNTVWHPIKSSGSYLLSKVNLETFAAYYMDGKGCEYETDSNHVGQLIITKYQDYPAIPSIISGTFNFKLKAKGCSDVNVTDGRFDISF